MYDLCAYFTNDGTVGLYSKEDDDVYHSTYGALSEAWEKFILPAKLGEYLQNNNRVKILDICYGIGYNSKAALQCFLNSQKNKKCFKNNKNFSTNNLKFSKNHNTSLPLVAAIDTDNIHKEMGAKLEEKKEEFCNKNIKSYNNESQSNYAIDSDNIPRDDETNLIDFNHDKSLNSIKNLSTVPQIQIDAIDLNNTLINLSPFVVRRKPLLSKKKYFVFMPPSSTSSPTMNEMSNVEVSKYLYNNYLPLKNEYRLSKEMLMILTMQMIDKNPELLNDEKSNSILNEKTFSPLFDKNMINFACFYQNLGYKHKQDHNKSAFLHNIYYRYLSKSYKLAQKLSKNTSISLNFHPSDARKFILSTSNKYDFIFLDAFTPAKCPELWTLDFFNKLFECLDDNGMILTYSNSVVVRNTFLQAGFFVGKIFDKNTNKFAGTIAVKNSNLIDYPLEEKDFVLTHSRAGIPYKDAKLNLSKSEIIKNREQDVQNSKLLPSSVALKGLINEKI